MKYRTTGHPRRQVKIRFRCTRCPWTALRGPNLKRCPRCEQSVAPLMTNRRIAP